MSNLSLKEQLTALSNSLSSLPENRQNKKTKQPPERSSKTTSKQKPAWLEQAQYGVELLKAYFPLCFKEANEIQPLKIGIKQDLVKQLSTHENIVTSDKACMVNSLSYYVNSLAYHKNMVEGAFRIDLSGNPAGVITAEEAQYSAECRKAKLRKKQPNLASPAKELSESVK